MAGGLLVYGEEGVSRWRESGVRKAFTLERGFFEEKERAQSQR